MYSIYCLNIFFFNFFEWEVVDGCVQKFIILYELFTSQHRYTAGLHAQTAQCLMANYEI